MFDLGRIADIIMADEGGGDSVGFNIGDIVELCQDSGYYSQSNGNTGKIVGSDGNDGWYMVNWSHGGENNYPVEDLILVGERLQTTGIKVVPGQVVILKGGTTAVVLPSNSNIINMFIDERDYKEYRNNEYVEILTLEDALLYSVCQSEIVDITEGFVDLVVYKIGSDFVTVTGQNLYNQKIKQAIRDGRNIDYVGKIDVETSLKLWNTINNS